MAKTKILNLSSTFQDITILSVCKRVMVKEDESVASYPTVNLQFRGSSTDDTEELTAGKPKYVERPDRAYFQPGDKAGQIACKTGTTTALQYEE